MDLPLGPVRPTGRQGLRDSKIKKMLNFQRQNQHKDSQSPLKMSSDNFFIKKYKLILNLKKKIILIWKIILTLRAVR